MLELAIFNSLVVFFAALGSSKKRLLWLRFSFTLIFLFLALRYNYGNDYQAYLLLFNSLNKPDIVLPYEYGWQVLNIIFKPFGFFAMVIFLSFINCIIYYRFIVKYVPASYYWLAVFIYVFWPPMMLVQLSSMRQTLALLLFIYSLKYLYSKKLIWYLLCIAVASQFHKSVIILLPLYLIVRRDWKMSWKKVIAFILLFLLMFVVIDKIGGYLSYAVGLFFDKYDAYFDEGADELQSGYGFVYTVIVFIIIILFSLYQKNEDLFLSKLSIVGHYIIPLSFIVLTAYRLRVYTQIFMIPIIPIIIRSISNEKYINKIVKLMIMFSYVLYTLIAFYQFFNTEINIRPYGIYKTIFTAPKMY